MKKIIYFILALLLLGLIYFAYQATHTFRPDKTYTMLCANQSIAEVNLHTSEEKKLYTAIASHGNNELILDYHTRFCRIGHKLYLSTYYNEKTLLALDNKYLTSSAHIFVFDIPSKSFLEQEKIEGYLLTCDAEHDSFFYLSQENSLSIYNAEKASSKTIKFLSPGTDALKVWDTLNTEMIDHTLFFHSDGDMYRYDLQKQKIERSPVPDCRLKFLPTKTNKLLCYSEGNSSYFLYDPIKKKKTPLSWEGGSNLYFDAQFNGFYYTRYDWDWLKMKEIRSNWFYSIGKHKAFFVDKQCRF